MVKILVTGATGYIGGDALFAIAEAHSDYEFTCTVRNSSKGALIAKQYPSIKLAYGDLDSYEMLVEEASKADIVLNFANCDHQGAAKAIVEGLTQRPNGGYLIHTSGTGILGIDDLQRGAIGQPLEKVYDDWDGINEVTHLPDQAWHRDVDKIVLAAHEQSGGKVNTAIVCPPTICGPGRGVGNKKSDQVYDLAKAIMKRGKGFVIEDGKNTWTTVHVHDLSEVYLKLTEAAAEGGGKATWNDNGYYFAEKGEFQWGDIARKVTQEAHKQGYIQTAEVDRLEAQEVDKLIRNGSKRLGLNSRCRATRARNILGWQPKGESIERLLPGIVEQEAKDTGLWKGHAVKAAGDA